jgi:hypothetical protein
VRKLSGVLITFDEEEKVASALASLADVCDEIVVVDSYSGDRTPEVCREFTARFFQNSWPGYRAQKAYATDLAEHDWVLSLDADECLSEELKTEIVRWKAGSSSESGYRIPRMTFFMGRWIRHTTWYPDWQVRLFRKDAGEWAGGRVHESFRVQGHVGSFQNHILHFTYSSISEYLQQLNRFTCLAAADQHERGRRAGIPRLVLNPPLIFLKNYVLRAGFLDGLPGFVVSVLAATSVFFRLCRLRELHSNGRSAAAEWKQQRGPKVGG